MSNRRMAALSASLLLLALFAHATTRNDATRITVLDSESRSVSLGTNGVSKNCDQVNFDAYCNNSNSAIVTNTLLVREGNGPPYYVACTVDSRFSRCKPLPKDESFEARRERHGIMVFYVDDNGRARSQLYTFVDASGKAARPPAAAENDGQLPRAPHGSEPVQKSQAPTPAPPSTSAYGNPVAITATQKIRCNFTSTPPDADITIDGSYVGNTPSEIGLTTGKHVVVIAKVGFGEWKRELTVASDSVVNVTANLQQPQP